jgi:DNA-binding PadR family transcriptional regulator
MSPKISHPLTIEVALLGYLCTGSLHGYQIYQLLQEPGGLSQIWRIKQANLYALLGKLEEAGLILGVLQAQETRPTRRVYQLTEQGRETFYRWLITPVSTPRQMRQEFLIKLYFAGRENEQMVITLVNNQLSASQEWLETHEKQMESAPAGSFNRAVHEYRLGQIQATLTWLEQLKVDARKYLFPQYQGDIENSSGSLS